MTKYILIGGYPRRAPDGGKALAEEMLKGFSEPINFLICYFARPKENWEQNFTEDKEWFRTQIPGKRIEFQIAQVETFLEQLKWANVMYMRGGRTEELIKLLNQSPGWNKLLAGKTIAGSSAGAIAIAKYSYELDNLKLEEGLGLLPLKVLVHYRSGYNAPNVDWDKALFELKNFHPELPLLALAEGQFEITNIDKQKSI